MTAVAGTFYYNTHSLSLLVTWDTFYYNATRLQP